MRFSTEDEYYFSSYAGLDIHEEMLKDGNRTNAYRAAILSMSAALKGKVVADIGAGTAVLSFFCLEAGAKKVYAIEASGMADRAQEIVDKNNATGCIVVIKGRAEDVQLPEKVDAIVSEWMGYFLLYESMLESVIKFRDRWLKQDGWMIPSTANLYLAAYADEDLYADRVEFWNDVYGIDMSPLRLEAERNLMRQAVVDGVGPQHVMSNVVTIKSFDCKTVTIADLEVTDASFEVKSQILSAMHGFVSWFDVVFESPAEGSAKQPVRLTTHPNVGYQHWKQTLFYVPPETLEQDQVVKGAIHISPNRKNRRFMDIEITYDAGSGPHSYSYAIT